MANVCETARSSHSFSFKLPRNHRFLVFSVLTTRYKRYALSPSNPHIFKQQTWAVSFFCAQTALTDSKNKASSMRNCAHLNPILIFQMYHICIDHNTFYINTKLAAKLHQTYHNTYINNHFAEHIWMYNLNIFICFLYEQHYTGSFNLFYKQQITKYSLHTSYYTNTRSCCTA